jgi:hypothetical protein
MRFKSRMRGWIPGCAGMTNERVGIESPPIQTLGFKPEVD